MSIPRDHAAVETSAFEMLPDDGADTGADRRLSVADIRPSVAVAEFELEAAVGDIWLSPISLTGSSLLTGSPN